MRKNCLAVFAFCLLLSACRDDIAKQIAEQEQLLAQAYSPEKADALLALYQQATKEHPDRKAENLRYMTRAADIKFSLQKDNVTAVRWLNEALKKYGEGQDLTETVGQLSRIWLAYKYKATFDLSGKPDDIDQMYANLMKNMNWLDSNLVRLEKEMGAPPNIDKVKAERYIQIAESYSTLVETGSFEKFADLNMKAASLARKIGEQGKAIQLYHRAVEKLPSWHPAGPAALTEQAHIYEEDMKDLEKAKESYRELLRLYPKNPEFAPAAEAALKSLEATQ